MFEAVRLRMQQGDPIIHDVSRPSMVPLFQGFPALADKPCPKGCSRCAEVCPTGAISHEPLTLDLGACVFCRACEEECLDRLIRFTENAHTTVSKREALRIGKGTTALRPEKASAKIRDYFGSTLKLRQVSAGGCNACELELNALDNVNFNMGRFGIDFVASPRHADGVVITGPITRNMAQALQTGYEAVPNPKIVILTGTCAISGGLFRDSPEVDRTFLEKQAVDLYIPGCPPHPLTFINGLLQWLDRKAGKLL